MRVRTIIELLGCQSFAIADERLLDRDVIVSMGTSPDDCSDATVSLTYIGTHGAWRDRADSEGILLVYVPVSDGESLEDLQTPPRGVVLLSDGRRYKELYESFRRLPELGGLLSLKRSRLHEAFLHSYDVQQFVSRSLPIIGNPIIVTNSDHRLLASAGELPEERDDVREVVEQGYVSDSVKSELEADGVIRDVRLRRHAVLTENPRFGQRWAHSIIYAHHMELGRFDVLESGKPITALDLELIDYAGSLAGIMIERQGVAGDRVGAGSSVLRDLITNSFVNERTMRAQVALTSLPLDESYVMLAVVGQRGAGAEYYTRAGRRVGAVVRSCLWTVQGNVLAVLMPFGKSASVGYDDYGRARRALLANRNLVRVLANNDMRVFVSEPFTELSLSPGRFGQCVELMDAVMDEANERMSFFWEERFRVLACGAKSFERMDALLDKRVVAMRLYDRDHGTQYFDTAIMSVRHPGSPAEAANALNVHRNTYFYRVNKVRELFFIDLKDGDDRLLLAFTARIMEGLGDRVHIDVSELPKD